MCAYARFADLSSPFGWRSACRSDIATYGTIPVGSLRPNPWGLFDVHGNVWSWCQESYKDYPKGQDSAIVDKEDMLDIKDKDSRVLRGPSFNGRASFVRCALRYRNVPTYRSPNVGFRPARTFR